MKTDIVSVIEEFAKENCIELERHPNYSGRGMFGQTTMAFEVATYETVAAINFELKKRGLPKVRWDELGFNYIIY